MDITQICITRVQDALKAKGYDKVNVAVVAHVESATVLLNGISHGYGYCHGPTIADAFDAAEAFVAALEPRPTAETIAATLGIVEIAPGLWREAA